MATFRLEWDVHYVMTAKFTDEETARAWWRKAGLKEMEDKSDSIAFHNFTVEEVDGEAD